MAQQLPTDDETLSEVNVIPLADLSLVLLIILMVMSPMISQALIHVASANATAALTQEELETPETPIIVTYAPGLLKINGESMNTDIDFVRRMDDLMARRRDKSVILTASPQLTHGKVVRLMDIVRRHGAKELVMVKWDDEAQAHRGGRS